MARDRELKKLRKELATEKKKFKIVRTKADIELEKRRLKKELFLLKNPTVSRIGRGFKVLGKKAGKGIARQAVLIKERQEREAKRPKKKGGITGDFDPFRLDF